MREFTDAVKARLETNTQGFLIGDAVAPGDDSLPYGVLYPLDEFDRDGDMKTIDVTGWYEFQVTSVGETREQAQRLSDILRALMLTADITAGGHRLYPWKKVVTIVAERDDDVQPPVFYAIFTVAGFAAPT